MLPFKNVGDLLYIQDVMKLILHLITLFCYLMIDASIRLNRLAQSLEDKYELNI